MFNQICFIGLWNEPSHNDKWPGRDTWYLQGTSYKQTERVNELGAEEYGGSLMLPKPITDIYYNFSAKIIC